jgi:23S rRNA (uridine2552-2'-O)-methyltransferase
MPKAYVPHDRFAKRAQYQGYRARSVYKLEELDQKFHLFKPGQVVLDVGAFPGSWLQYVAIQVGPRGKVVGVDIQPIQPVAPNVQIITENIENTQALIQQFHNSSIQQFDLVISDIAPSTTGIPGVDQAKSVQLSQMVVEVADQFLRPKGTLVMKVFEGQDFAAFFKSLKDKYGFITAYKAKASRDRSIEKYIICQRKR